MRRALIAVPLALAVAPAAHAAPQIQTDRACYYVAGSKQVAVSGTGFAPSAKYSVLLDGTAFSGGSDLTSDAGGMTGTFPPSLGAAEFVRSYQLTVQTETESASTSFEVSRFTADFTPSAGAVRRLKVRFSVYGFGLDPAAPRPDVYVHWIAPGGKLRATALVGKATGPCGSIASSSRRRLFPFGSVRKGVWKLQFDTRRKFKRGKKGDNFLFYTVGVRVT